MRYSSLEPERDKSRMGVDDLLRKVVAGSSNLHRGFLTRALGYAVYLLWGEYLSSKEEGEFRGCLH